MPPKKTGENIFASAAIAAQSNMQKIVKQQTQPSAAGKPTKGFIVRLPADLHKKAFQNRVETGESINTLIIRLLKQELDGKE